MKNDRFESGKQFLAWMDKRYPGSRTRILRAAGVPIATASLNGLGSAWPTLPDVGDIWGAPANQAILQPNALPEPEPAWYEKIASAAASIVPAYLQYKQQDKITDMQIERMKRDLPPIQDPGQYMAPAVKIQHTVDPSQFAPSQDTKKMLWIGGGILGVIALLMFTSDKK